MRPWIWPLQYQPSILPPLTVILFVLTSALPSAGQDTGSTVLSPSNAPTEKLAVVGLVGTGKGWQVLLQNCGNGAIRVLREGQTAFGYRVKRITFEGVLLGAAGKEFELRVGDYSSSTGSPPPHDLPSVTYDTSSTTIPDLARMGNIQRQLWVEQWRYTLSSLTPEAREAARKQMQDYWREQWEGGLVDLVSTLDPEEQVRIRTEIRRYWRE